MGERASPRAVAGHLHWQPDEHLDVVDDEPAKRGKHNSSASPAPHGCDSEPSGTTKCYNGRAITRMAESHPEKSPGNRVIEAFR
jgi:hypothetical protein